MVKVCDAEVSAPPFAVPPLSLRLIVMVADPFASAAGVKVNVPVALIAGATENREARVLLVTWKFKVCVDSSAGPATILVAQLVNVCAPASSSTVGLEPLGND